MLFPTYEFCFVFLPLTLCIYFLLGRIKSRPEIGHLFLVLASWFFYGYFRPSYLLILVGSNLFNYSISRLMYHLYKKQKFLGSKLVFLCGIISNLLILSYFKYYDFFVENINHVFHSSFSFKNIILPLGISFFIFQQILFLVERYQSKTTPGRFLDYLLFVSFFPQLVAGPIVTYSEIIPQLHEKNHEKPNSDNSAKGLFLFVIGLFKKIILADSLALLADNGYSIIEYGFCSAWITSISYTFQIYFDFSGYSDMARGLGHMFNIELPVNFDSPYRASSIKEFWQRWHMTLSRTLRHCIYIPLGGSRNGMPIFCFATMITFLLSGLWHGAAWTFVLWGVIYGGLIVFERAVSWQERVPYVIRRMTTFFCINSLWVLFRADNLAKAADIYRGMFHFAKFDLRESAALANSFAAGTTTQLGFLCLLLIICFIVIFAVPNSNQLAKHFRCNVLSCIWCVFLLIISIIGMTRVSSFIYFNF